MDWKFFAEIGVMYLRKGAKYWRKKDANNTGKDDALGVALDYAADLVDAVLEEKELPKAPAELR